MKVFLITGAASGLGWAMAQHWFQAGHHLALVDRNAELLAQRQSELGQSDRITTIVADVTQTNDQEHIIQHTQHHFGWLDVLVNNAGITHRSPAHLTDPKVFRQVMSVDWQAPVELTLLALPLLEQSHGQIVNIGSMAGWMPVPGRAAYGAAKSALTQFFEVLRLELQAKQIHVLMVYPGFIDTPIEQNALGANGQKAGHARSTIGKMISAETMALQIDQALKRKQYWLFPEPISRFGSYLWRLAPHWYLKIVRRKFVGELQ